MSKNLPDPPEATFQPGDLVVAKSGGPVMTVAFENTDFMKTINTGIELGVHCYWMSSDDRAHSFVFPPATLVKKEVVDEHTPT